MRTAYNLLFIILSLPLIISAFLLRFIFATIWTMYVLINWVLFIFNREVWYKVNDILAWLFAWEVRNWKISNIQEYKTPKQRESKDLT